MQVLKPSDVTRLLDSPDLRSRRGRRDRALLALMALGGLRIAEACALRRDQLSNEDGVCRATFAGKGGKTRTVTLPALAAAAVRRTLSDHSGDYVTGFHRPLPTRSARRYVQTYFEVCGFEDGLHPHSLRHTCATTLLRATDMRTVQRMLGHADPRTTAKYYDGWDTTDADRAASAMDRVFA